MAPVISNVSQMSITGLFRSGKICLHIDYPRRILNCIDLVVEFTDCLQNGASQMVLDLVIDYSRTIVECAV
jgi:hypothetical protein